MKTVKSFDKSNAREIHNELNATLAALSKKYGINVSAGAFRYNTNEFHIKVIGEIANCPIAIPTSSLVNGTPNPFDPSNIGKCFKQGAATFEIIGFRPNRPKYSISAKNVRTGTPYLFSATVTTRLFTK